MEEKISLLLAMSDEQLVGQVNEKINYLEQIQNARTNGKKNKKYISKLKQISVEKWKEIFNLLSSTNLIDGTSLDPAIGIIIEKVIDISCEEELKKILN